MKFSKFFRFLLFTLSLIFINDAKAQYINVDTSSYTPQQLVEEFLGAKSSGCISISGVKVKGDDAGTVLSYGYFDKGSSSFDIDKGVVLSTGNAQDARGGNTFRQDEIGTAWGGDSDLSDILGVSNTNATYLEFDFISYTSNKISFEYMFLSEEYDKDKSLSGCPYSDIFAFLIKQDGSPDPYTNIALVPGTNDPVSVVNVRGAGGRFCLPKNEEYFGSFNPQISTSTSPTNFNGQTKVLTAIANVEIGKKYHIKLVIADEGTPTHDSAVFLKAGSFVGIKDLGADLVLSDGTALCTSGSHIIDATPDTIQGNADMYIWYKDGVEIVRGKNIPKYEVLYKDPGFYEVEILLDTGCKLKGQLKVEQQILPLVGTTVFSNICDEDLDGDAEVYFNLYSQQIISNISQDYGFNIQYFENPPADINHPDFTKSISSIKFKADSKDIYLWVKPGQCPPLLTKVTFNRNLLSSYDNSVSNIPFDICDNELKDAKEIDMSSSDYISALIPAGNTGILNFYNSQAGANTKDPSKRVDPKVILNKTNSSPVYYVRFNQPGLCDNVARISFRFRQPKKSTVLTDTLICKGDRIDLDAGTGLDVSTGLKFTSYKWNTGDTIQVLKNVRAGEYLVELGFNGCVYKQHVKISEPEDLIINNTLIEGDKVTVLAANGIPPYRYRVDNGPYQSSNIFDNIPKGDHTAEVMDACGSLTADFSIINIKNVITPNEDGVNDFIDYSDLMTKSEPRLEIYNRNGLLVFKGDKNNKYIWDGKLNGTALQTSSYWYILEWNETGNPKRVQMTGWILLKNRE